MSRNHETGLNRALVRLADRSLVGLLVLLGFCGIVTAPASLAAGAVATRSEGMGEIASTFWTSCRRFFRQTIVAGVVTVLLAASSVVALLVAAPSAGGLTGAVFTVQGLVTAFASLICTAFAAASVARGNAPTARGIALAMLARPLSTIPVMTLWMGIITALLVIPVVALPLTGWLAARVSALSVAMPPRGSRQRSGSGPARASDLGRERFARWKPTAGPVPGCDKAAA